MDNPNRINLSPASGTNSPRLHLFNTILNLITSGYSYLIQIIQGYHRLWNSLIRCVVEMKRRLPV